MSETISPYFHYYNRGVNRDDIFFSSENYEYLIQTFFRFLPSYPVELIAYCLMPNHYHILLRQNESKAGSAFIQRVFNSYTQAINRRYNRVGTLFQGSVKNRNVDDEAYIVEVIRYIHLNPVYAKIVKNPAHRHYSDYLEWIGKKPTQRTIGAEISLLFEDGDNYEKYALDGIEYKKDQKFEKYRIESI
jgi:putative transposase